MDRRNALARPIALVAAAFALVPSIALACTAFQLRAKDGAIIYFRSMEFGFPFRSKVLIVPRGTEYVGFHVRSGD